MNTRRSAGICRPAWQFRASPGEKRRLFLQHAHETAGRDGLGHIPIGEVRQPRAGSHRVEHEQRCVDDEIARDIDVQRLASLCELPSVRRSVGQASPDALVPRQV